MQSGCDGLSPGVIGIEATPVIGRAAKRVYISYRTNALNPEKTAGRQKLAVLDLITGRVTTDVFIPLPPGSGNRWELIRNRSSLLLVNGVVYVAFGSRCEDPGQLIFHGWISAHSATSLQQVGTYQTTSGQVDGAESGRHPWA